MIHHALRTTDSIVDAIAAFIRGVFARRSDRLALSELLTMTPHQLDDLGICAADVIDALRSPLPAGLFLAARREACAQAFVTKRHRGTSGFDGHSFRFARRVDCK